MTAQTQKQNTTEIGIGDTVAFTLPRHTAKGVRQEPYTGIVEDIDGDGLTVIVPGLARTWIPADQATLIQPCPLVSAYSALITEGSLPR